MIERILGAAVIAGILLSCLLSSLNAPKHPAKADAQNAPTAPKPTHYMTSIPAVNTAPRNGAYL